MAVKILVVDDNEINAMLIHDLLEGFSIDSDIAESGEQAIDMISNNDYIFILMDYVMPEMDGIEATKIICRIKPLMRIYAMTGDLGTDLLREFMNAGATGALSKPIKLTELYDIIRDNLSESEYTIPDILREKFGDGDISQSGDKSADIDLKVYLEKIPQLDYNTGLSNIIGNTEGYKRLLKASIGNIREYDKVLSQYPKEAGREKVRIALHSLKSVFANIGIENLRLETALMEKLSVKEFANPEEGNSDFRTGLKVYLQKLSETVDALEEALSEYERDLRIAHEEKYNKFAEKPLSDEEFAEVADYTRQALERFEIDFLLEGLDHMKKAVKGDERRNIEKAIDAANEFDYDVVKEIVDSVIENRKEKA